MPTEPLTVPPATPAALNTRRTAAGVKADRRSPSGPGLDTGEDRRILTTAGTTPKTTPDHRHNADERMQLHGTPVSAGAVSRTACENDIELRS
jgi:hypothetical protein